MRLLIISPYFPPQHAVASLRVWSMARAWASRGHQISVLTTAKRADQAGMVLPTEALNVQEIEFTCPRNLERLRATSRTADTSDGAVRSPSKRRGGLVRLLQRIHQRTGVYGSVRMPDLTDYWVSPAVDWAHGHGRWDVAISSCGPYTAHLVGMQLRRINVVEHWVADFRDPWTKNHHYRGLFPFTIRERYLERQCLRTADMLCAATAGVARSLRQLSGRHVEVIYNGYSIGNTSGLDPAPIFPRDGRARLVYTGTVYPRTQNLLPLLQALGSLKSGFPRLVDRFQLVVAGIRCECWRELAAKNNTDDLIDALGIVSYTDALRMQRDADALLLLDMTDPSHGVLPVKMFEYLPMQTPILVVGGRRHSELGYLVGRAGRGTHCAEDRRCIERFVAALLEERSNLVNDRDDSFIESLSRERQSLRLLELMRTQFAAASEP